MIFIKITDDAKKRFEVPVNLNFEETDEDYLDVNVKNSDSNKVSIEVTKRNDEENL
jgi:hypothetical protein